MKRIKVAYFALAAFCSAVSCTKEAAEPDVYDWADGKIHFKPTLPDMTGTRAMDMTAENLESFQVTCFNSGDIKEEGAIFAPHFEDATFIRKETPAAITYESSPYEEPKEWPANSGKLIFYAFSPSRSVMAADNSAVDNADSEHYFKFKNRSTILDDQLYPDYRLEAVRVNPDISRQFDFITASASGERMKDFYNEVELAFSHQMSQVELRAWGDGSGNDFEIAGVRIGNPVVEDNFVFADISDPESPMRWDNSGNSVNDKVEYLYRGQTGTPAADDPSIGDRIYSINKKEHNSLETAGSIMGLGGCAKVIPTVNSKWEGLSDPNISTVPYSTDKMYFSILMRVSNAFTGKQVYPYAENPDGLTVVHYAVDEEGAILARVYPGTLPGTYFTDPALQQPYAAAEGVSVKEFGWAAVPVEADWTAGKRYVYTLDYSEGIGLHDPEDPKPGTPIKGQPSIKWGMHVTTWSTATPNEDYTPDIVIP